MPAEGAAFIALKRLEDALRDSDEILGLIKGSSVGNDGRSGGLLSPDKSGQIRTLESAYQEAGIDPASISFIECHATGTSVGDGTELSSLEKVFHGNLVLGSLKANIGHSITISGVAGVMKVLGAFKHKTLPQTPSAFPTLDALENSQFEVLHANREWQSKGVRRAGINSFGFGGNNAHLILEEWGDQAGVENHNSEPDQDVCLVAFDAKETNMEVRRTLSHLDGRYSSKVPQAASIDIRKSGFPPRDLKAALGQQTLALELAQKLAGSVKSLNPLKTSVFMVMCTDAEVCRFAFRARLEAALKDQLSLKQYESIAKPLDAEDVLAQCPMLLRIE